MSTSTCFRVTLLSLAASLLLATSAQAQQQLDTVDMLTASTSSFTPATSHPDQPAGSEPAASPAMHLSTPPPAATVAAYYNDSQKDMGKALAWMVETNAFAPAYWNVYTEARIRLQMKDYAGARATAEKAQKLALAASPPNQEYAELSSQVMAKACTQIKSK